MHNLYSCMILSLVAFSLTCFFPLQAALAAESLTTAPKAGNETGVGVILDQTSRPGKEAKVAIELAVQDFNIKIDQPLVLYLKNSRNKHVQAVIAGLEMIVPARSRLSNQPWLFLKPFTAKMWWITVAITLYNGFVIWFIERNHNKDLQGNIITQIGIILWLAFSTLFTLRGDKMHSNLSRMAVIVWLFVALIITQSYTASLASMLTAQRLEPTITSFEMLRDMNATIGYCNGSFINEYLVKVLNFTSFSIKNYSSTDGYAKGLNSGEIKAIFLEVPAAKVFLAQYCKSFIRTGETFKVGGFGFAFRKDFPNLSYVNEALMNVSESGLLKELEDKHLISEKCVDEESSPDENGRLNLHSFWVLFVLTVGTSTVALVIYIVMGIKEFKKSNQEDTNLVKLISAFIKDWQLRVRRSSSIVASVESARGTIEISIN